MSNTRKSLSGYEGRSLLLFLCFIGGLFVLGAFVLREYRDRGKEPPKEIDPSGIMDEVVSSASNSCYFYMGAKLTDTTHKYRNKKDIPTSDVLATNLFNIPGVIEVTIDETMIVLQKANKAHWEEIRPLARDVIKAYLHPNQLAAPK
jgi:hypothetical protein